MFGGRKSQSTNFFDLALTGIYMYSALKDHEIEQECLRLLTENSLDTNTHREILDKLKKIGTSNPVDTASLYNKCLEVIMNHPENENIQGFTIEIGKWHFASFDPPKRYTYNDLAENKQTLQRINKIKNIILGLSNCSYSDFRKICLVARGLEAKEFTCNPIEQEYNKQIEILFKNIIDNTIKRLKKNPSNRDLQVELSHFIDKVSKINSELIYNSILDILQKCNCKEEFKIYVLKIGRWHFGKKRFWGQPKEVDEITIQNDILARCN